VTPTQLRAFACVVRLGSVKAAADELGVSEAAVSMHVGQLRKELDDQLFTRTAAGLAFTPGGLRLASRAVEILGLQDRTVQEVSQAGNGRRLLRMATSSLFAEHAAPGLIELFASRAADLDVELSVRPVSTFPALLAARTVDIAIGTAPGRMPEALLHKPFLNYDVVAVVAPEHRLAGRPVSAAEAREATWLLGPSAAGEDGVIPGMLRHLAIPEAHQRIFQSDAAAIDETKRGQGVSLALRFAVATDLRVGRLHVLDGGAMRAQGRWSALALPTHSQVPATAELLRFITTPRATQAMVHGAGVKLGRFRPSVHVTLWS
jgi:DNA-binding transcriptional LysR family regulator